MRGPKKQAIVVRSKDGLVKKVEDLKLVRDRYPILGLPLIRGIATFGSSMVNGVKALMYSADFFPEDEDAEPDKFDIWLDKTFGSEKAQQIIIYIAAFLGIFFSIAMFILLPTAIAGLIPGIEQQYVLRNIVEGGLKICIFIGYLALVSRMKDIRRVFSYHGAEHKTIFCYEAGLPLTVENARIQPRHHPRCGTSFLFVVIIVSILVSSIVFPYINWQNLWVRIGVKLLLLIPVVGVTYEFNRFVGRHDNMVTRVLSAPGMWLQNFTTNEPDDSMLEVAIEALKLVLPDEEGSDTW